MNDANRVIYSDIDDVTNSTRIFFSDGHSEIWNDERVKEELNYRGLKLLKTQTKLAAEQCDAAWRRKIREAIASIKQQGSWKAFLELEDALLGKGARK